jgi:hypothetical protein
VRYALLIYPGELTSTSTRLSENERAEVLREYTALLEEPGVVAAEQLQPPASATTVQVDNGKVLITDGPFANTKEILGGLFVVEAENLDQALELAARIPGARMGGAVEVRPLVER